ncbi:hypothetical protein EYF80_022871 [Liparis tanakae]|uniref:Uncharacterized protein n=1 Tax=Liparis tanakae TaxID=230148 RepID=A0A4Z2HPS0_9TELE|nr:hypothetical protein EYF80_022871 [Liparis tanakae]
MNPQVSPRRRHALETQSGAHAQPARRDTTAATRPTLPGSPAPGIPRVHLSPAPFRVDLADEPLARRLSKGLDSDSESKR